MSAIEPPRKKPNKKPKKKQSGDPADVFVQKVKLWVGGFRPDTRKSQLKNEFLRAFGITDPAIASQVKASIKLAYGFISIPKTQMEIIEPKLHEVKLYVDNRQLELELAMSKAQARQKLASESPHKLYVGGLPLDIKKAELQNYFGNFGELVYAHPVYSPGSIGRGFAFIKYVAEEDAMKVLGCKRHIIREWCLWIKKCKTRSEISSKKVDKVTTGQISQGREFLDNKSFKNDNQSEHFTPPAEDSVGYQGYYPSPPQGYSSDEYYYPSIANSPSMNENLYSPETAYKDSFDSNSHDSWQIGSEKTQMSPTPNAQINIMSQQCFPKIFSKIGNAHMGQGHGQQYCYPDTRPKSNSQSHIGHSNQNQMKTGHASFGMSTKYLDRRQNNMQKQQAHYYKSFLSESPTNQISAHPKKPEIMINLVAADENPYANDNHLQEMQSQQMEMPSLGCLTGTPQNTNQLLVAHDIQHPGSKSSIDNMRPTLKRSLLNPNDQGRVPLQNQNNQTSYTQTSYSHWQILKCLYQEQLYAPEYQGNNPSPGQSSEKMNQLYGIDNNYDPYYYHYPDHNINTLESNCMSEKLEYSQTHNSPTKPSLGATHWSSRGSYQPDTAPGDPDQRFCDDFSQLQIRDPQEQLPISTVAGQLWNEVSQNGQRWNEVSQPSQDQDNTMYYDRNYQENPGNQFPDRVDQEQSYYYFLEPQYSNIKRKPTSIGESEGYSNFNGGYPLGDEREKNYANPQSENKDLGYLPEPNIQDSNWHPGRFDGVSLKGNYNEKNQTISSQNLSTQSDREYLPSWSGWGSHNQTAHGYVKEGQSPINKRKYID